MGGDWTATRYAPVSGGRRIAYCEYGDPEGQVVFYFHGCPGSRYEPALGDEAGKERGYRIVALDRPGVGRSGYVKGRQLLDWPQDVVAVAEYLEIERFGVTGASGGGPYVLACCRAIPERLTFAAVMGSWAPVASDPALWAEMAPLDRFFGKLSRRVRWAFYAPFSLIGFAARWLSPQGFVKSLESSMSAADKAFVADEAVARFYAEDVKEAFRQGVQGPADDAIILYGDWGFDVAEIDVKVHIFHGKEDRFAPYRYALYLDERIPRTRLYPYPGKGHLFLLGLFDEVLAKISA
ncbi:MAG: alpha/beta hydrolase [Anaerolineae bacterium]